MRKPLFILGVACLSVFFAVCAVLAAPVGKVTIAEGKVDVLKANRTAASRVAAGDAVDVGDIYRAKSASRMEITFLNKNVIRVAPGSRVEIKQYMAEGDRSSTIAKLHRGKIQAVSGQDFIKRVTAFAEGNKFEVHTLNAVAGIRGSNMIVSLDRGATMVLFVSGKGYLYNPLQPDVIVPITAGSVSFVTTPGGTPTQPRLAGNAQIQNILMQFGPRAPAGDRNLGASPFLLMDRGKFREAREDQITPLVGDINPRDIRDTPTPPNPDPDPVRPVPRPARIAYQGTMTDGGGGFYSDYPFTSTGNLTGTLQGIIPADRTTVAGELSGTFLNPNMRTIWATGFEGTTMPDAGRGAFLGYGGGSWTSWTGSFAALYAEAGGAGFLFADPTGTHGVANYSGTGPLSVYPGPLFVSTLNPGPGETMLQALKRVAVQDAPVTVASPAQSFGTASFGPSMVQTRLLRLPAQYTGGKLLGVLQELRSGFSYSNEGRGTVTGIFGTGDPGGAFYEIGTATLTDDGQGRITLFQEPVYMDRFFTGAQATNLHGTYDASGNYRMSGAGYTVRVPLAFVSPLSGTVTAASDASGNISQRGSLTSLMGSVDSLFSENAARVHIVGSYEGSGPSIWSTSPFFSTNYNNDTRTTYDTVPGAFAGLAGGIQKADNSLEGMLKGIYIDPSGTVGYLTSELAGAAYSGISMFELAGNAYRGAAPSQPEGITAANFYSNIRVSGFSATGQVPGPSLAGAFNVATGGSVMGSGFGTGLSLSTAPWGVYQLAMYGHYGPVTNNEWSAIIGGPGTFGTYSRGASSVADTGYWIGNVWGTQWSDNVIRGYGEWDFITRTRGGFFFDNKSIAGDVLGSYPGAVANSWQAVISGQWEGKDLAFVSDFLGTVTHATDGTGSYSTVSELSGLMGGTATLGGDSAPDFILIGATNANILPGTWLTLPLWSRNYKTDALAYTTYDANPGAYVGLMGGRRLFNALGNKVDFIGHFVGLYLEPDGEGYSASYLKSASVAGEDGGVVGTGYPGLSGPILEMDGTFVKELGPSVPQGVTVENFHDRIAQGSIHANALLSGGFVEGGSLAGKVSTGTTLAIDIAPWGVYGFSLHGGINGSTNNAWSATVGGTGSFGAFRKAGGSPALVNDFGYWRANLNGTVWDSNIVTGTVDGDFITYTKLGSLDTVWTPGILLGSYDGAAGTWQATALGTWEASPLTFVSPVMSDLINLGGSKDSLGLIDGLLGGTGSIWNGGSFITMKGAYIPGIQDIHTWSNDSFFSYNYKNDTYTTYDGGAYKGFIGGTQIGTLLDAMMIALYINEGKAGYVIGNMSGEVLPEIRMFDMTGDWYAVEMEDTAIAADALYGSVISTAFSGPNSIQSTVVLSIDESPVTLANDAYQVRHDNISGTNWGIWASALTIANMNAPADAWTGSVDYAGPTRLFGQDFYGTEWFGNRITATTTGYGADITGTPKTWISVGQVKGTFDGTVASAARLISAGHWIETTKYLDMAANAPQKLEQLNIPSVQVGIANLTGAGNNLTVNMSNVKFFSAFAGDAPSLWATNSITGTYTAAPSVGVPVALSGSGLTANFTVKNWDAANNKWLSAVTNGAGTLGGGSYAGGVQFRGAAAGPLVPGGVGNNAGTFTGTGAGVAKGVAPGGNPGNGF